MKVIRGYVYENNQERKLNAIVLKNKRVPESMYRCDGSESNM